MIAKVEMGVATRSGMDIDMEQTTRIIAGDDRQPCLLGGLTQRGLPGLLPRVDVTSRLQPHRQALVKMQHDAGIAGNDGRGRDVG